MKSGVTYQLIRFDLFPNGNILNNDVGVALVRVEHGLAEHHIDFGYQKWQQLPDGSPDLDKVAVLSHLGYEIDSHVSVIAMLFKEAGFFSKNTQVITSYFGKGLCSLILANWSDEMEQASTHELALLYATEGEDHKELLLANSRLEVYLHNILFDLEISGEEFSKNWYYAKILHLYFRDIEIDQNTAFSIGILHEQLYWKFEHEKHAVTGQKNQMAREAAEAAKPLKAVKRKSAMLNCIARLWHEARNELGSNGMRMDTNAAQAIYARAEKERPSELIIKKSGKVKGPDAIRRLLPELRASGKID